MKNNELYDVVVIGGGASGMMTAGRAGEVGKKVLLLEKNKGLGKKLLITGGGRCNLTNNKLNIRNLVAKYKGNNKFLFSCFTQFGVQEALDFFNNRGVSTKLEAEDRVFPASNLAKTVWDCLVLYLNQKNITVKTGVAVSGLSVDAGTKYFKVDLQNGEQVSAKACVVASGGTSRPETGSTGEGFLWLKKLGHKVIENNFALVPVALKNLWAKKLSGVTLKDIKLTIYQDGKKQYPGILGKLLFTHFGISGPTVLNMSKSIGELLLYGEVVVVLDLFPKVDGVVLKEQFQTLLITQSNKKLKNVLSHFIPSALVSPVLEISGINGEIANHSLNRQDRIKLVTLFKSVPLNVKELLGADKAVVSSGGVDPKEVNFKTMESLLVPNLFLVGDILNIDRPSGGYSLQLCWSTGFVAGTKA